jgi:hypothetical protein
MDASVGASSISATVSRRAQRRCTSSGSVHIVYVQPQQHSTFICILRNDMCKLDVQCTVEIGDGHMACSCQRKVHGECEHHCNTTIHCQFVDSQSCVAHSFVWSAKAGGSLGSTLSLSWSVNESTPCTRTMWPTAN